jgi:hypothetical protein
MPVSSKWSSESEHFRWRWARKPSARTPRAAPGTEVHISCQTEMTEKLPTKPGVLSATNEQFYWSARCKSAPVLYWFTSSCLWYTALNKKIIYDEFWRTLRTRHDHFLQRKRSGQSSRLQIERSRVRFLALSGFLRRSGSGTGSTQPREDN